MRLINIHKVNTLNVGDLVSSPSLYYSFDLPVIQLDITKLINFKFEKNDVVLVGGGGLLEHTNFHNYLKKLILIKEKYSKLIFWGVGKNSHFGRKKCLRLNKLDRSNKLLLSANLVGVRDKSIFFEYVPCASCLNPTFQKVIFNEPLH
ncbi:hypothetical protein HOD61_03035, partial [archaeon]|nr:hypothetical protein [archaeon]